MQELYESVAEVLPDMELGPGVSVTFEARMRKFSGKKCKVCWPMTSPFRIFLNASSMKPMISQNHMTPRRGNSWNHSHRLPQGGQKSAICHQALGQTCGKNTICAGQSSKLHEVSSTRSSISTSKTNCDSVGSGPTKPAGCVCDTSSSLPTSPMILRNKLSKCVTTTGTCGDNFRTGVCTTSIVPSADCGHLVQTVW